MTYSCGSNGTGTPTDSNSPYIDGATVTALTSSACTASDGYTFYGWYCDNGVGSVSSGGTFTMPSANTTCTAQYTAIDYTVSFAAGTHGSGSMSPQTNKHVGDTITLSANEFTPSSGYGFNGWNCNNNIGDKAVNETFTMPAANVTCTAQWMPVYTVTYSCGSNGTGTPTDSNSPYIGGATVTALTSSACTASGYTFNGWSCDNNVGSVSSGGTFTMPAAAVTCTAQWALNTVNLTWYREDGTTTLSGGASSCTYGGTITPLPTAPAKPGYHFARWKVKQCKIPSDLVNSNSGYTDMYELGKLIYSGIGKVQFDRKCSNTNGTYATPGTPSDTNGRYCWCAATAWIPDGGNQCNISNPVWVFRYADEDFDECETYCSETACASEAQRNSNFRSAVFGVSN